MATSASATGVTPATQRFPRRITRRVTLFLALLILGGLAVGGTSVALAFTIVRNHDAVVLEYDHVKRLDAVHAAFHDLVFELHQVDSTGGRERALEATVVRDELFRALDALPERHAGGPHSEPETGPALLAELRGFADAASALTEKLRDGARMTAADLDSLHRATHVVPRRVDELAAIHRTRIAELVGQSRSLSRTISVLFVVFLALGIALLGFVSVGLNRDVASPLRALAASARAIAEGRLDARVAIQARDEIGQLAADFNHMAERLQVNERSLREAQRDLQQKAHETATLQERERLAREMHDGFAQSVALLNLKLQAALTLPELAPAVQSLLREMSEVTLAAYQDVRQSIFGLRTFVSRGLGFEAALAEYLHEFAEQNRIGVDLDMADGALRQLPRHAELQVVRIIQEALVNVRKHSAATSARVRVRSDGDRVQVSIEDDGLGWEAPGGAGGALHFGLQMMRERAESLGGALDVCSAPGQGTRVVAWIPKEQP